MPCFHHIFLVVFFHPLTLHNVINCGNIDLNTVDIISRMWWHFFVSRKWSLLWEFWASTIFYQKLRLLRVILKAADPQMINHASNGSWSRMTGHACSKIGPGPLLVRAFETKNIIRWAMKLRKSHPRRRSLLIIQWAVPMLKTSKGPIPHPRKGIGLTWNSLGWSDSNHSFFLNNFKTAADIDLKLRMSSLQACGTWRISDGSASLSMSRWLWFQQKWSRSCGSGLWSDSGS